MNKQIKKSLMAVAVGAALAAAGYSTASAETLLFPYWSTQNGTTSILSLSAASGAKSMGGTSFAGTTNPQVPVHFVWNYGNSCTHFDNYATMSPNDLLQQFVSQPAGTPALFGDQSTPAYFPPIAGGSYGFLIVSDNGGTKGGATGGSGTLRGQMILASASAGIVTSYSGIPGSTSGLEGDFSNLNATGYMLSWYPQSVAGTSWYGVVTGDEHTAIANGANWGGAVQYTNGGEVFGRDEDSYSGSAKGTITCAGTLTPASFMNSAQLASATNGGIVNVSFTPGSIDPTTGNFTTSSVGATGIVLTKIETTTALGSPNTFVTPEKATTGLGW